MGTSGWLIIGLLMFILYLIVSGKFDAVVNAIKGTNTTKSTKKG